MKPFHIIKEEPGEILLIEGMSKKEFGRRSEIVAVSDGARVSISRVMLSGPGVIHYHSKRQETFVCEEGEGKFFLEGTRRGTKPKQVIDFVPGVRIIVNPRTLHAAKPNPGSKLVFLLVSSPAIDYAYPDDLQGYADGQVW